MNGRNAKWWTRPYIRWSDRSTFWKIGEDDRIEEQMLWVQAALIRIQRDNAGSMMLCKPIVLVKRNEPMRRRNRGLQLWPVIVLGTMEGRVTQREDFIKSLRVVTNHNLDISETLTFISVNLYIPKHKSIRMPHFIPSAFITLFCVVILSASITHFISSFLVPTFTLITHIKLTSNQSINHGEIISISIY